MLNAEQYKKEFFYTIINLAVGEYQYKFFVDGNWRLEEMREKVKNTDGSVNNVITVTITDAEIFEALRKWVQSPTDPANGIFFLIYCGLDITSEKFSLLQYLVPSSGNFLAKY